MTDSYKFPGGDDVKVVRKQDIVNCINTNIIDKEVALAVVQQCEIDAIGFLRQGRWTGIPFMGSIRASKVSQLEKQQKDLIEAARHTATVEQYVLFRRNLAYDNSRRVKAQKYYNYVLSMAVSRNRPLFKKLCKEKGVGYARIHFFLTQGICAIENELIIEDEENSND
jgi:hypothetical protein